MALRDFAEQFVDSVLRDVIVREQQLTAKSVLHEVQYVVPQMNLAYRDVAAQFVSGVLRGISIGEQQGVNTKADSPVALSETESYLSDASIEEDASEQESSLANNIEPEQAIESIGNDSKLVVATPRSIMAQMVQNFASEVIANALEKIVIAASATNKKDATSDFSNTVVQQPSEDEKETVAPLVEQQQRRPVSRRQLIHKIAKATNDHVLAIVLQSVTSAVQAKSDTPSPMVSEAVVKTSVSPINGGQDDETRAPPPSAPEVARSRPPTHHAEGSDTDQMQPPVPVISADDGSIRSQVAHEFVYTLLSQAASSELHAKPRISVQSPPPVDQEISSSGAQSRRKSPNVHKRNLVKKDSTHIPSATQPSPPPPEKTNLSGNSDLVTPDTVKSKRTGKRDPRPKRHPHKTHEKAASGDDSFTVEATSPPTTKSKLTLPLEDSLSLSSTTSSPLSSARLAQEIYRPRKAMETSGPLPVVLKKPTARAHPRRHPHHIQNAAVATETSYSRDSPRADALALELQRKEKSSSVDATIAFHMLLPLPAQQSPAQSPTSSTKKQSLRDKNVNRSPAKMRSGFCQQCVFEGRSCKINDCLKHQLIK